MASPLVVESSILYATALLMAVARFASQKVLRGSFTKFQAHDALAVVALATDLIFVVVLNIVPLYRSNLIDPNNPPMLTSDEVARRVFGSKLVLVTEQTQILTIWLVKVCFLLMYNDIITRRIEKLCVKIVAGYVAVGFIVMEVLYFAAWCRPFHEYWAVPTDNIQCSAATNHLITNAVLNISSDVFIILIPMPMLIQVKLPIRKKILLGCLFAMGLFTIGCAIANKFYSFSDPYGTSWTYWYLRESSIALIVLNMPFLWTILRVTFKMRPFFGSHSSKEGDSPSIGQDYGHNMKLVSHSIMISRGTRAAQLGTSFTMLHSNEDLHDTINVPLRIYKVQEVHVSSEVPDSTLHTTDHVEFHT